MKTRILSIVTLLLMAATGAWAQDETLLTTITATGKEQASYSPANVATVSFSYIFISKQEQPIRLHKHIARLNTIGYGY